MAPYCSGSIQAEKSCPFAPPPIRLPRVPHRGSLIMTDDSFLGVFFLRPYVTQLFNDGDNKADLVMTLGSQGATSVLVFAAIGSPLAQPRNVVGGNIIAAFIGVAVGARLLPGKIYHRHSRRHL